MIFTQDADEWLREVDPWNEQEASGLLLAIEQGKSIGVFDCASTSDGNRWFVMAPYAETVLLLPSAEARRAVAAEVALRYGLRSTVLASPDVAMSEVRESVIKAVNDSGIMPLRDRA